MISFSHQQRHPENHGVVVGEDIAYYLRVFKDELKRDPTTVECFDLAQAQKKDFSVVLGQGWLVVYSYTLDDDFKNFKGPIQGP